MEFENLDLFGSPFEIVETYIYYEGPQTFAMRSLSMPDLYYFLNTADEEHDSVTALAVAVSGDRFRAVRSGLVAFRQAFVEAPAHALSKIIWTWLGDSDEVHVHVEELAASAIPDRWLPMWEARLDLPTDTGTPFKEAELISLSSAQSRTIFALEVAAAKYQTTELPARTSGELQLFLAAGVDALARETARRTKAKPKLRPVPSKSSRIAHHMTPMSIGMRAASYVFLMAIDSDGAMEATEVTAPIFESFNALVSAVSSEDAASLLAAMKEHQPRVRSNFRKLLATLTTIESGLSISAVVAHTQQVIRSSATASQVRSATHAIETAKPKVQHLDIHRGLLTGLVIGTKVFVLSDLASGITYRGHMDDDASAQANGLPVGDASYVSGRIRIHTPFAADEDGSGLVYFLETITPSDAPG
jgi:hypothetical protein